MKKIAAAIIVLVTSPVVSAETLTLVCEHDRGERASDGTLGDISAGVFRFSIDLESRKIADENLRDRVTQVRVTEDSISFLVDTREPTLDEWPTRNLRILINRHSGSIFINQFGVSKKLGFVEAYARGTCQEPGVKF